MASKSRRPHRKSKTGCDSCKGRKIKCDERKPTCLNCEKHSLCCEYVVLTQVRQVISTTSPRIVSQGGTPASSSFDVDVDKLAEEKDLQLNLLHLELLHHYSTFTAPSISSSAVLRNLWRVIVPEIAFSCTFVMYGVLAVSAYHLARFNPEKRDFYISKAKSLHQAGLRQSAVALANLEQENCTYIYIFSALTCNLLVLGDRGLTEWLIHIRGTRAIIAYSQETLKSGPLGPMFTAGDARAMLRELPLPPNTTEEKQLNDLYQEITYAVINPQHCQAYSDAIDGLKKSFAMRHRPESKAYESTDALIWIFRLEDDYLALLQERTQEALAIFAFFCVLLKRMESTWWMEGWSFHLLSKIYYLLDVHHRLWIQWAMEESTYISPTPYPYTFLV